jgi:hypothetical protein
MRSICPQLENMPYLYLSVPLEIPDEGHLSNGVAFDPDVVLPVLLTDCRRSHNVGN